MTSTEILLPKPPNEQSVKESPEYTLTPGFVVMRANPQDADIWLKMGQLRAKVYVDEKEFLPAEVLDSNGAEYDEDDGTSTHFVAVNEIGEVLGTIRVISRADSGKLPSEALFSIELPDGAREISRIMVDSSLSRRVRPLISMSLIRAALQETTDRDDNVYAVVEPSLRRYLNDLVGITLTAVTNPVFIKEYNTINIVVSMHPRSIASQIHERDKFPRSIPSLPEKLGPFFEQYIADTNLGATALRSSMEKSV